MEVRFSVFAIEQYDDVLGLWRQCEGIGLGESDTRENILTYLQRNPGMSFIAMANERIIGTVLGGHDGRRGYIHHLAVAKAWQRRGLGQQLVRRCLSAISDAGIRKCHIFVFKANKSGIAFWEAAGWTVRSDVQPMSKDL